MQMRTQAGFGLILLTLLSQSATAQAVAAAASNPELNSRPLAQSAQVELEISRGEAFEKVWLLSVDEPSELVAVRARLEGNFQAKAPSGDHDFLGIQLDAAGSWNEVLPAEGLREWYQIVSLNEGGKFAFSDLSRGSRSDDQAVLGSALFQDGFVIVTEFMKDPAEVSDTQGEWFELFNAGPHRANLEGWVISDDGSNAHLIFNGGSGLWVLPRKRLVFGRNDDVQVNGGVPVDYVYSGFTLGNSADQIVLSTGVGRLVDRVDYDNGIQWPDSPGMSISLRPGAEDTYFNDDPANWCHSSSFVALSSSDTGTPGEQNDVCP